MKGNIFNYFAVICCTLIARSGEQTSVDNLPRITTNNGNLMFQTGMYKDIQFETQGDGKIKFNEINVKEFYNQMKDIKANIIQIKNQVNNFNQCDCNVMKLTIASNTEKITTLRRRLKTSNDQFKELSVIVNSLKQTSMIDECSNNPCHNGGTCIDSFGKYKCICTKQYKGQNCMEDVNECEQYLRTDLGCQNDAVCENYIGGFRCVCNDRWSGVLCNIPKNRRSSSSNSDLCGHGIYVPDDTVSNTRSFNCICDNGWSLDPTTKTCILDNNECTVGRYPCSEIPNVPCYNSPGGFTCGQCPAGYTGNGFSCFDVNECLNANICGSNQRCINNQGSYQCVCVEGMTFNINGICERQNVCLFNNGGCNLNALCSPNAYNVEGRICVCSGGYVGNGVGPSGCSVFSQNNTINPHYTRCVQFRLCKNGGSCQATNTGFRCQCTASYIGERCRTAIVNRCLQNPCINGGACLNLYPNNFMCKCTPNFTGLLCEIEHTECGGTIISPRTERNITFMVSSSAYRYPCTWVILVSDEQFIQVKPISLQLFGPCNQEYLKILEKSSSESEARELGTYCEVNSAASLNGYNTTSPILVIKTQLRNIQRLHGFTINIKPLNYISQNVDCCRCLNEEHILTNNPDGIFQSPHFPLAYPEETNCIMQYERTFGQRFKVEISINTADLGDSNGNCSTTDYIKIIYVERGPAIINACNQPTYQNQRFITSGFKIEFHSDSIRSTSLSRFQLVWKKTLNTDPCGGVMSFIDSDEIQVQQITESEEAYCTWLVRQSNVSQLMSLKGTFTNWQDGDCSVYIKIINIDLFGNTRILWEQCQNPNMIDDITEQVSGKLIIIFRKAVGVSTPSFRIFIKYICGKIINMDELQNYELTSSNYPNNYENNLICTYKFVARTRKFSVKFIETDIVDEYPCNSDFIEITGASRHYMNGKYCNGNQEYLIPIDKLPSFENLVITFITNSSISGKGFKALVSIFDCGGSYYVYSRQVITYPEEHMNNTNFDISYKHNKNCVWNIFSPPGSYLMAIFDHFHLEFDRECYYDYLSVTYDNVTSERFCGTHIKNIITRSNKLNLVFTSDFSINGEGFIMRVYVGNIENHCHQDLTLSEGIINNPLKGSLPRPYICIYSITVPSGRKVIINTTIDSSLNGNYTNENLNQCYGKGRLKIKNTFAGGLSIAEICPSNPQRGIITTSSNKAFITYYVPSYGILNEFNFTISFGSIDEECGSIHDDDYGEIASPNYPLYAPINTYCQWKIQSTYGKRIRIEIIHVKSGSVSQTSDCNRNNKPIIKFVSLSKEISISCEKLDNSVYTFNDENVRIIFKNDENTQYRFRLVYRKICIFTINAIHGRIESNIINYRRYCLWTFNILRGNKLMLQFDEFDLPNVIDGICKAFVEVKDSKKTLLPRSCGNTLINNTFESMNFPVTIMHYVSRSMPYNILQSHRGFSLEYNTQGCIYNFNYDPNDMSYYNTYQKRKGIISSPQYPNSITNIDCLWTFKAIDGYSIKLVFTVIESDTHVNCSEGDILKARDSENMNDPYVFKTCKSISPKDNPLIFQSSTNYLDLFFTSSNLSSGGSRKFQANFEFINSSCEYEISATEGIIKSPNYPNVYPQNLNCKWSLSVRQGMTIYLKFLDFETEGYPCNFDYVEILSKFNSQLLPHIRICGNHSNSLRIYDSISNKMIVKFKTDTSVQRKGFIAQFFEGCGGLRIATDEIQFLQSPNYPHQYSVPYNICEWTLTSNVSKPGERIFFYFLGFESSTNDINENCSSNINSQSDNSIIIIDGYDETPIKATMCSSIPSPPIISSGHSLRIKLKSTNGKAIFKASYSTGNSACGGEYYLDNGLFTSPFYPVSVNIDIDCLYIIKGNPGSEINLRIEDFSRTNENFYDFYDFLEIQVGNSTNKRLIGRFYHLTDIQNNTISSFKESVFLRLRSQGGPGTNTIKFLARYHINYITLFENDMGSFSSPQFGHVYSENTRMVWTINPITTQTINIEFSNFSVGRMLQNEDCSRGKLMITGGNGESKTLCGSSIPSAAKYSIPVTVTLVAEGYRYPGFFLKWSVPSNETHMKIGDCMYRLQATQITQILTSPNFPNFDPINRNCQWTIVAPRGSAISLKMLNFTLELSTNCKYENFTISFSRSNYQSRYYGNRNLQRTICGTQNNSILDYTDKYTFRTVTIKFRVDKLDIFPGFKLQYKLKCFQEINEIEGWLQNKEFPSNIITPKNCTYFLRLQAYRYYQLNVTSLNLPIKTNNECQDGYLEIIAISTYKKIGKYCGTIIPSSLQPLITNSSSVFIRLVGSFTSSSTYNGFQLKYSLVEDMECGGKHILSRNTDEIIISNIVPLQLMECKWFFVSPYGTQMKIDFIELIIPSNGYCNESFMSFYDGSTILAKKIGDKNYCNKEKSIFTTGNKLLILFKNLITFPHFNIRVSVGICGGSLYKLKDTIITPNYPHNYPKDTLCIWKINFLIPHNIQIRFDDFSLYNDCNNTKVMISSEQDQLAYNLSYCNYETPTLNIIGSTVQILFLANSTNTRRGFKLSYEAYPRTCGGSLTDPSGEAKSNNFPSSMSQNVFCSWRITTDITKRVTITIIKLNLRYNCLKIYNKQNIRIQTICQRNLENFEIDTKSSEAYIYFYSDGSNRLFFSYHTDLPSLCGSHIYPGTNDTGMITFNGDNTTSYCHNIVHNYDGNTGTVAFYVVNMKGLICWRDSITFQSIVLLGIGIDGVIDEIRFCSIAEITNEMYSTIGKQIDVIFDIRSFFFQSRVNISDYSISILYKYQDCGGLLTEPFGYITSPNYPNKYPHHSNCEWIIRSPDDMHIQIIIHSIHLEQSMSCRFDHLNIRSGPEYNSPIIKKFCGRHNNTNETVIFQHNLIRVSFKSDFSVAEDGFSIQYTFINAVDNCNGIIFNTSGAIQSPNYPRPYPGNTKCNWTISVPQGYQIELAVQQPFDLEPDPTNKCLYDALEIVDSNPNVIITRLCGHIPPNNTIISSENRVGLLFTTDHNANLDGFRVTYKTVCGGKFNNTFGQISSPNVHIITFGYISQCSYIIPGWKNYLTVVKFKFSLGPCRYSYDYVEIWKEIHSGYFSFSQKLCGKSEKDVIIFNPLSILIKFNITYYSVKAFSFSATYLHDESIKIFKNFTNSMIISTPHFPTPYHHNADLQWQFQAPPNYLFFIEIQMLDIESSPAGCIYDYVAFYNGNNTNSTNLIEKLCGKPKIFIPFKIESNNILIHFYSDSSHYANHSGFMLRVSSSPGPQLGCGGSVILDSTSIGFISSLDLNNDGQYENNLICEWRLSVSNGYTIELRFENSSVSMEKKFRNICRYDWIKIFDGQHMGSQILRTLCGNDTVDPIISSGSNLLLIFNTDSSITGRGFKIRYSTILSPNNLYVNATNEFQILTSPGYPDSTNYNLNVMAEISAPNESSHILIEIKELFLRTSSNCSLDYFEFRDSSLKYPNQIKILCKPIQFVTPFISSDNRVVTYFHIGAPENENSVNILRFKFEYKIFNCNRTEKAFSGRIFNVETLKNSVYAHNTICNLTLEAPSPNLNFQFYFKKMKLEESATCSYDYIQFIFGRQNEQLYTLPKICGRHLPPSIVSNSSYVTIMFVTDNSIAHDGFDITYVVNQDSQQKCGGDINLDSGVITSPGFGRNIYESGQCIWNIALVSRKQLEWKITDLQLESNLTMGQACTSTTDYLKVTYQNVVKKFCGNIYPSEKFVTQTSAMIVEYKSLNGGIGVGFRLEWNSILV